MPELLLEISYNCNLNCIHCSSIGCTKILSLHDITIPFENHNIETVRISGGEPLLLPNLYDYIKKIKEYDPKKIILQTNGTLPITKNILKSIDEIWISLYGNVFTHNAITMKSCSFYKTIKFVNDHKDKKIILQTPIFNYNQCIDVINIVYDHDLDIRLSALLNQGRCNFASPIEKQIQIAYIIKKYYKNIIIPCSLDPNRCELQNKLVMKPDKSIFNCASHKHGNILCKT